LRYRCTSRSCRRLAAAFVTDEETVLAVWHDAPHLALGDVVVDWHRGVAREHVQLTPLPQRVTDPTGGGADEAGEDYVAGRDA
jgi:hypothetical protein